MRTFTLEHLNYATVKYDERNGITILSPEQILLIEHSKVVVGLGELSVICNTDSILIEATQCKKHSKRSRTNVNLLADQGNILLSKDGFGNSFQINAEGFEEFSADNLSLEQNDPDQNCADCDSCMGRPWQDNGRVFVVNRNLEGEINLFYIYKIRNLM